MKEAVMVTLNKRRELRCNIFPNGNFRQRIAWEKPDFTWMLEYLDYRGDDRIVLAEDCTLQEAMSWVIEANLPIHTNFNTDQEV